MKPWLLDRRSEAPLPDGYGAVENEVALLQALLQAATNEDDDTAQVRGEALCVWAQNACRARVWRWEEVRSPLENLLALAPALSRDQAATLLRELELKSSSSTRLSHTLSQTLHLSDVLQTLYPDFSWHSEASLSHAACWLLWREIAQVAAHHQVLIEAQTARWQLQNAQSSALYVASGEESSTRLRQWLHLEDGFDLDWSAFAMEVPPRWMQEIRKSFAQKLTRDGVKVWSVEKQKLWPRDVLPLLAQHFVEYLEAHAAQATPPLLASLQPLLSQPDWSRLQTLSPPPFPREMPQKTADVLRWATHQYLPFRRWQAEHGDQAAHDAVQALARDFTRWYLSWYSGALMGLDARFLATQKADRLRQSDESSVVLWIIADGLGWLDAQRLQHLILQRSSRLSASHCEPVFAPLPTITHFCKRAVRWGTTPRAAINDGASATGARRENVVASNRVSSTRLKQSAPGELIIWQPLEPDQTYHKTADRSLIHQDVEGALISLSSEIVEAILQVPPDCAAKIVLTTDHGRLLGQSQRRQIVPGDCEAHGRTAYFIENATSEQRTFEDGVCYQDDLAWLEAERFGLPTDCAIVLDDSSFLTNSQSGIGRGGQEEFPHGGAWPEEVVIPWIEIERDALQLALNVWATGRARANTRGTIQVSVENPNSVALTVHNFVVVLGGIEYSMSCDAPIAPFSTTTFEVALNTWPTSGETKNLTAWLEVSRASGTIFKVLAQCVLEVEALQSRDEDLLDDMN